MNDVNTGLDFSQGSPITLPCFSLNTDENYPAQRDGIKAVLWPSLSLYHYSGLL